MPSSVIANSLVVRAANSASEVSLQIDSGTSSYNITLPTEPPRENSALLYDGTKYVWSEVMQSIPQSSIPEGYENFQVFNTSLLIANSEMHFTPPGGTAVRMQINQDGAIFFQKKVGDEWVGAQVILDS